MIQIDERFKDASPVETVAKIRKILADNNISVIENKSDTGLDNCHACRITIEGTHLGSNGKGVTEELASASAHAELMERLQSGNLGNGDVHFTDSKVFSKDQVLEHCGSYLEAIAKAHPTAEGKTLSAEEMAELAVIMDNGENATVIPFYNITDDCMTYFPKSILKFYTTTGLAAGNSPEEAIVQGLSEIIERNALLRITNEGTIPPDIPDEFLKNFPDTYETLSAIRAAGYDITIKDCSMQGPFPVLAAALVDKRTHRYHIHMGCHPLFEIALRRTLTETFQGRTIKNVTTVNELVPMKGYKNTHRNISSNIARYDGAYPTEFFGNKSTYDFKPFKDRSGMNNKELLAEMVNYIHSLGYKMLIRDHSSLGFGSYRIIIPGFCETRDHFLTGGKAYHTLLHYYNANRTNIKDISEELANVRLRIEGYWASIITRHRFSHRFSAPLEISSQLDYALYRLNMAHFEWAAKNYKNALAYLEKAISLAPQYDTDYLHCLNNWIRFITLGCSEEEIYKCLSPFYEADTINSVAKAIKDNKPFAKYAHCCDDIECNKCNYKYICLEEPTREITEKINAALKVFDNETAFKKLKELFQSL